MESDGTLADYEPSVTQPVLWPRVGFLEAQPAITSIHQPWQCGMLWDLYRDEMEIVVATRLSHLSGPTLVEQEDHHLRRIRTRIGVLRVGHCHGLVAADDNNRDPKAHCRPVLQQH